LSRGKPRGINFNILILAYYLATILPQSTTNLYST
jgi:hypothetical protein